MPAQRKRSSKPASSSPRRQAARSGSHGKPVSGPLRRRARPRPAASHQRGAVTIGDVQEIDALRRELERTAGRRAPSRWNADPDEVRRSVAQLVLTLIEFIRRLLERQAIRRMEGGTLSEQQTEDVGLALMQLERTIQDIAGTFGIPLEDLNLDLGPVGKLL